MKRISLIISFYICFSTLSFAQRNYAQELVNLMQEGKCFEARDFRIQYADKLPQHDKLLDLLYKTHMYLFFNRTDSAIICLEKLLGNRNHELILGPITGVYYGRLLKVYGDKQQFEAGIKACDKMLNYLQRNPFMFDQSFIQNEMKFAQTIKASFAYRAIKEPRIMIKRNSGNEKVELLDNEYIRFNAKYNDVTIETLFDTGVSHYFFIQEDLANEIGVKIIRINQDSTQIINGIPVRAFEAIIDSVDLKGVKLYNIPVMVFKEKFTSYLSNTLNQEFKSGAENVFNNKQIMMGLPTMKLIGKLEFDWKNRMLSFPKDVGYLGNNDESNIYLIHDTSYLQLKINGLNYVGYLDTGSNTFLNMIFPFYEKNKNCIEIDTLTKKRTFDRHTLTGTILNIPCKVAKNIKINLGGKSVNNSEVLVFNILTNNIKIFDGEVGAPLLKGIGPKIVIDFDNMKIESEN